MQNRRAFTLIELLVVVAIIVVLMAMLMPALARARKQARMVQCQSNLRQMGAAMMLYSAESDNMLMDSYWWLYDTDSSSWSAEYIDRRRIPYYINNADGRFNNDTWAKIGRCPDSGSVNSNTGIHQAVGYGMNVYCYSRWDGSDLVPRPLKLTSVAGPSEKILFADTTTKIGTTTGYRTINTPNQSRSVYIGEYVVAGRHNCDPVYIGQYDKMPGRTANAVFLDGHVEFLQQAVFNNWGDYTKGNCLRYVVMY